MNERSGRTPPKVKAPAGRFSTVKAIPWKEGFDGGGGNRTRVRGRTGQSVYKLRLPFHLARTAGVQPPYRRASHPLVSRLRRLALLRHQPVHDAADRATGP